MDVETIKKPKEFLREFLDEYLSDGFGAKTKREIDILLMSLLMKHAGLADKSNQELSIMLQTPTSRIKGLRYEARLKYPPEPEYVKREFLYLLTRSQFDFEKGKIIFAVEDEFLRQAIQGELKAKGMFADTSFNTEIVKIDRKALEEVIRELYDDATAGSFRDGFDEMEGQLEGKDAEAEFRETITKFALDTIKSFGFELIKSRIGF